MDLLGQMDTPVNPPLQQPSGSGTMYSLDGMMDMGQSDLLNKSNKPQIILSQTSDLDSERFQQLWMQLPVSCGG